MTPSIYETPEGHRFEVMRVVNQSTGQVQLQTTDGQPVPLDAQPVKSGAGTTDPVSKKEYDAYVADEAARGNKNVLSYDKWLTMDANRKRPTSTTHVNLPGTTMTNQDRTAFRAIVSRYQASPLLKAKDRLVTLDANIKQIKQKPGDPASQLALAYSFIQALDTYQSAVREGELQNLNEIDSRVGNLKLAVDQMTSGRIVRPEIAKQIAAAAETLSSAITHGAARKGQQYKAEADVSGLGTEWDQYIKGGSVEPSTDGRSDADFQNFLNSLRRK